MNNYKKISLFLLLCVAWNQTIFSHEQKSQQGLCSRIYTGVASLGDTKLPLFGEIKHILPIAVASFCISEYPKQTLALIAGVVGYALYYNDTFQMMIYDTFLKPDTINIVHNPINNQIVNNSVVPATSSPINSDIFVYEYESDEYSDQVADEEEVVLINEYPA